MSRKERSGRHDPATAERVTSIVEAAERAASALIDSADAKAKRYLEEAEAEADRAVAARLEGLVETTDALLAQAEEIRRESERLLEALRRSGARVEPGGNGAAGRSEGVAPRGKHLAAVPSEPEPAAGPAAAEPDEPAEAAAVPGPAGAPVEADLAEDGARRAANPSGARLLATQMAVSGSSREEIEARLRSGFEIEDTASILDAILGPEE